MKKSLLLALSLTIIGWFPLLGLTAAVPLYLGAIPYNMIFGAGQFTADLEGLGDRGWPFALFLATLSPWCIPAALFIKKALSEQCGVRTNSALLFPGISLILLSVLGVISLRLAALG